MDITLLISLAVLALYSLASAQQARLDRCFDGTDFVSGAQGCMDEAGSLTTQSSAGTGLPYCEVFFPTEPVAADVATNTHPCYKPDNKQMANKCRRRCKTCCLLPAYGSCEDQDKVAADQPIGTAPVKCDPAMCGVENFAVKLCPKTCGRCVDFLHSREDTKLCDDEETSNNCLNLKELGMCKTPDAMQLCALTCNDPAENNVQCVEYTRKAATKTGGGPRPIGAATEDGKDQSEDCKGNKKFCRNSVYKDLMKKFCPETCGTGGCEDNAENCSSWKANGFCENEFYSLETRTDECGATCGLC